MAKSSDVINPYTYATRSVAPTGFKRLCTRRGWNVADFDRIIDVDDINKYTSRKHSFYIPNKKIIGSVVGYHVKDKKYYATHPITRGHFKLLCAARLWDVDSFTEERVGVRENDTHSIYLYKEVIKNEG